MPPVKTFSSHNEEEVELYRRTTDILQRKYYGHDEDVPIAPPGTYAADPGDWPGPYIMTIRVRFRQHWNGQHAHDYTIPFFADYDQPVDESGEIRFQLSDFRSTTWKELIQSMLPESDLEDKTRTMSFVNSPPVDVRDVSWSMDPRSKSQPTRWRKNTYDDRDDLSWSKPFYLLGIHKDTDARRLAFPVRLAVGHQVTCEAYTLINPTGEEHDGLDVPKDWTLSGPLNNPNAKLTAEFSDTVGHWCDRQSEERLYGDLSRERRWNKFDTDNLDSVTFDGSEPEAVVEVVPTGLVAPGQEFFATGERFLMMKIEDTS